jgi:nucleotide-binding universal stress UspA family protein
MKILVTLDGSHFSEAILGTVAKLAPLLDAEVELFTVGDPGGAQATPSRTASTDLMPMASSSGTRLNVPLPADLMAPPAESRAQALVRTEDTLRSYLLSRVAELPGVRTVVRVEFADDIAGAIVGRARDESVDLIAMATHGRSGLGHLLAGSVCEQVIRSGVAPVVVLRP